MLLEGKTGIIMGIANDRSIATAVANSLAKCGATLGFSHLPDVGDKKRNEDRVRKIASSHGCDFVIPCDVKSDESISQFFSAVKEKFGKIDFIVHSIAFAPTEELKKPTLEVSRKGFLEAMDVSAYSLISVANHAKDLLKEDSSIVTMTYYGGEKVLPGYNLMGVCKAALESSVKYLAYDLGPAGVRVNAISAGPIKTLASSAVGDFKKMLEINAEGSPLKRNVTAGEVGDSTAYLVSDYSKAVTGEVLHVDAGYNIMG